jgi:hypothetical protein
MRFLLGHILINRSQLSHVSFICTKWMAFQSIDPTAKSKPWYTTLPMSDIARTQENIVRSKFCANAVSWRANSHGNCWWPWRSCSKLTWSDYWFGGRKCIYSKSSFPSNQWGRITLSEIASHRTTEVKLHVLFCVFCFVFIFKNRPAYNRIFMTITFQTCSKLDPFIKNWAIKDLLVYLGNRKKI